MLRVIRTVPTYFPYVTGPANQVRAVARGLRGHGFSSQIITTMAHAAGAPAHETIDGSAVERLPVLGGPLQYTLVRGAWRAIGRQEADLVHVHSYRNYLADVAAMVAARRRLPLVLHLHGSLASYKTIVPPGRRWLYRAYDLVTRPLPTLRAHAIVVSTRAEAAEAIACGLDPGRVHIIPMGIEQADYELPGVERNPRRIVMVGRLCRDRNVELLLLALAQLRDRPWSCAIVGGEERRSYTEGAGYLASLRRLAGELRIAGRVAFIGPLTGQALREAYAGAGIFVYTSRWENFGQTLLEAAAAGCALVSTEVGVAPELIEDGMTGFSLGLPSPGALAESLRVLLDCPSLGHAMGERVKLVVRQRFAWPAIFGRYAELYEGLLATRRAAAPLAAHPRRRAQ